MRSPSALGFTLAVALAAVPIARGELLLRDGLTIHPPKPALHHGFIYWSTSDTTIRPDKPNHDFGGADTLQLRPGADRVLIRFEHLLTSLGGPYRDVSEATLTLTLKNPPIRLPDPQNIHVYEVRQSWNEGGRADSENYWAATWRARYHSRRANVITWAAAGLTHENDAHLLNDVRVSFDRETINVYEPNQAEPHRETAREEEVVVMRITGLADSIERFLARRYENHGWLIRWDAPSADDDATLEFHSREATKWQRECRPQLLIDDRKTERPEYKYDLGVAYITRYPEYFAWLDTGRDGEHGGYERKPFRGQPGNGILKKPAYWDTPKNPQPGDTVWYTGRIKNHGPEDLAGGYRLEWRLNDRVVKTDEIKRPLPAGWEQESYVALPFPDRLDDHRDEFLTLHVEPLGKAGPENKNNNARTIFTKGRAAGVVADETARDFYKTYDNAYGTRCFEDWIQFQMDYWNEVYMAKSRFKDLFPDGAVTRVRIQRVTFERNDVLAGGVHIPFDLRQPKYDGMWGWDFVQLREKPELAEDDNWFFRQTLGMIEPSLTHEMSHQCFGLIDVYWMNMEPARNAEDGTGGKVRIRDVQNPEQFLVGVGYMPRDGGLMGGGDTRYSRDHEGTSLYSSHSVGGLNYNAPYRGGFFGDYVYDVPKSVSLKVVTADGTPASNAEIKIWQSNYGWDPPKQPIDDKDNNADVYFTGQLDSDGTVQLPNQPTLEDDPFTTLTGHTLKPNIFGRIHVVAFNGDMLVRIHHNGKYYYHFMVLWEFNVAYWSGQRGHFEYTIRLSPDKLPGPDYQVGRHSEVVP